MGGEVICCGGAFNSPQVLQVSGIGNAKDLGEVGVKAIHDLPGVGENLQDHLEVYIQYGCKLPVSVQPALTWKAKILTVKDIPEAALVGYGGSDRAP